MAIEAYGESLDPAQTSKVLLSRAGVAIEHYGPIPSFHDIAEDIEDLLGAARQSPEDP